MNVRALMTEHPTCVALETPVDEAARLMRDLDIGALPVCEGDRLAGILTDRDIVVRHVAEQRMTTAVGEIMTTDPYTIGPDAPLERAEALMAQHQVRRAPVCEDSKLIGIIAQADLARRATHEEVGALVEAISAGR